MDAKRLAEIRESLRVELALWDIGAEDDRPWRPDRWPVKDLIDLDAYVAELEEWKADVERANYSDAKLALFLYERVRRLRELWHAREAKTEAGRAYDFCEAGEEFRMEANYIAADNRYIAAAVAVDERGDLEDKEATCHL